MQNTCQSKFLQLLLVEDGRQCVLNPIRVYMIVEILVSYHGVVIIAYSVSVENGVIWGFALVETNAKHSGGVVLCLYGIERYP